MCTLANKRLLVTCGIMCSLFEAIHSQQQWTRKLTGHAYSVTFNPQNSLTAYAGVSSAGVSGGSVHRLYVSRNAGETWDSLWSTPTLIPVVAVHPLDTLMMLVGTLYASTSSVHGLWRTTDGGGTWSQVLDSVGFIGESIAFDRVGPNKIYVGCNMPGGFYSSSDYGETWLISPGTDTTQFCTIVQRKDSTNIFYAGSFDGDILKSTDSGRTWRHVLVGPGVAEVPIVVIDPQNPLVAYATHYGPPRGISKTTDGGENWFKSGLDSVNMWSLDIDPNSSSTLLAGEFDPSLLGRMFRSTNAGETWTDFSAGLPPSRITHWTVKIVSMEPPLVLAAVAGSQGGGVYKLEEIPSSVSEQDLPVPMVFRLNQNYPNPFNPSTAITYKLFEDVFVRLRVFDVLGREILSLVDEYQSRGFYSVKFNADGFPSGLYFYRIDAGGFGSDRKMLLIR